jgi:hypothetical protein
MAEHRQGEHQALFLVGDPDAPQIDATDVGHRARGELLGAPVRQLRPTTGSAAGAAGTWRTNWSRAAHSRGVHAVLAPAAIIGEGREFTIAEDERVVVGVRDEKHRAPRRTFGRGHRRQERRTRCLERRDLRWRIDAREHVLGFCDLPVHHLQAQGQLHVRGTCGRWSGGISTPASGRRRRQVGLKHDDEPDLARGWIRDGKS